MNIHIEWMNPHWWLWVLAAWGVIALTAALSVAWNQVARNHWADQVALDTFSPPDSRREIALWVQWALLVGLLVACLCGPNVSALPESVAAGAVEWENVFDVSPSQGAEDTRPYYAALTGERDPGESFQWGTRLDTNKAFFKRDILPQLVDNKAGIITLEGVGYNMWDLTGDLVSDGAFQYMLNQFVQVGSAPGAGCDFTSGIQAALDEFDLMDRIAAAKSGTANGPKARFIALWTDGGFTGDREALNKVLDKLVARKIRLLIVNTAGRVAVPVRKFDADSHKFTRDYYEGSTAADSSVLNLMVKRMNGLGTLIEAPPGTKRIEYSVPQQAGGLYSRPVTSNLKLYFLAAAALLFLSITTGGGFFSRRRFPVSPGAEASDL